MGPCNIPKPSSWNPIEHSKWKRFVLGNLLINVLKNSMWLKLLICLYKDGSCLPYKMELWQTCSLTSLNYERISLHSDVNISVQLHFAKVFL